MSENQSLNSNDRASEKLNSVSVSDGEATFKVVEEAVLGLWEVVNGLTTIRPPKRENYRVTIFGSARIGKDTPIYNDVKLLATELTAMGCDIVTGGGPGLMEAANEGSVIADPEDKLKSIGIRVALEFEQNPNPFVEQIYQHRTFFSRLHHFILVSDAFVVVPGGIGTTLEALMIWQLLQVRQLNHTPLIMLGEMWSEFRDWATKYMVNSEPKLAKENDMNIPQCVDTVEEAIAILRQSQGQWKSKTDV